MRELKEKKFLFILVFALPVAAALILLVYYFTIAKQRTATSADFSSRSTTQSSIEKKNELISFTIASGMDYSDWSKQDFPYVEPLKVDNYPDLTEEEKGYFETHKVMLTRGRLACQNPRKIMDAMGLKKGDIVAEVGCGTGFFTFQLAKRVGKSGKVYALDTNSMAIKYVKVQKDRIRREMGVNFENIEFIQNETTDLLLPPGSIDIAFLCDIHLIARPSGPPEYYAAKEDRNPLKDKKLVYKIIKDENRELMENIRQTLKPGGKLVIIDENTEGPLKSNNLLSPGEVRKYLEEFGFEFLESPDVIAKQHFFLIMRKK
ncbi:MAG: methyltransferase domain-containing protein [Candidatus Eremiobacteraeota bacterium]|nr:methyltransferase domain-containing protein [Candidatus Eremiobacteraeota bacterium]